MLQGIRELHCWIVAFRRYLTAKYRITPPEFIGMDIASNSSSGFLNIIVLCQSGCIILEAAESAHNYDMI